LSAPSVAKRVGVFGGAFDPPHLGHVALAQTALKQLQLDCLHVVPTGQAWHKDRPLTPAADRVAMARLAFTGLAPVLVDEREIMRTGASYTVDTLQELAREYPQGELFLIVGQDQARVLSTWQRWSDILRLATICVASRPDSIAASQLLDPKVGPQAKSVQLEMPRLDVSATEIRRLLAQHCSVAPLVAEPVARYIETHHLYQTA